MSSEKTYHSLMPPWARVLVITVLGICFLAGLIWRLSSWHESLGLGTLVQWGKVVQEYPATPIWVLLIYALGGLLFFVHAILLWATVFTFDPWRAFMYCQLGSLVSALFIYSLGRVLRRDVVARMAGSYMEDVSHALAHKGTLSLFVLHVFPICPFSMLNLLAGATHVRLKDFIAGTVFGMTPGILLLCFFGNRLLHILQHPQGKDIMSFAIFVGIGVWAFWALRRRLLKVIEE